MADIDSSREHIYYGGSEHRPPQVTHLKAGPLNCQYEAGYLRYIKAGNVELLRMIYPAVRDHNWGTVLGKISNEEISRGDDHFEISYESLYEDGEILFQVKYRLQGDANGAISFEMDGEALSDFRKNRIGFNVLHPPQAAGSAYRVEHTNGTQESGTFPEQISPHQPVMDMQSFRWKIKELWAVLNFKGDFFEMEDQRNWTDASFKTYSTPLAIPFPVQIEKGNRIRQKVSMKLEGNESLRERKEEAIEIRTHEQRFTIPAIGIGQSSEVNELPEVDLKLLKNLHFSHYRVDIHMDDARLTMNWKRAVEESEKLDLPLELALYFGFETARELGDLKDLLEAERPKVKQLMIFSKDEKTTPESLINQVLPDLKEMFPQTPIGGGTDCFFTELNRNRVTHQSLDFLSYSLNPQVHQFDNQSLVETLIAQTFTVESARHFAQGKAVHISPITLKMRFNPNSTGPEPVVPQGKLPPQVDRRQMSLFGAGWAMGSIKYLTETEVPSVTYFETLGRRGIMHGSHESQLPENFRSEKGMLYPMYWVFYLLLKHQQIKIIRSTSSEKLKTETICWEADGTRYLMVANLQPYTQKIAIQDWKEQYECLRLDDQNFEDFTQNPDFLEQAIWLNCSEKISLGPYGLAILR